MLEPAGPRWAGAAAVGTCGLGRGGLGWGRAGAGAQRLHVGEHILAGDAPAAAGTDDLGGLQAVLPEETANGRGHPRVGIARGGSRDARGGSGCCRGSRCGRRGSRCSSGGGRRLGGHRGRRRLARGLDAGGALGRGVARRLERDGLGAGPLVLGRDDRDLGVVGDCRALLREDLREDARVRRRDLGVDLVGDDLEEGLELRHRVARLLEPATDRPLGHALAELGHRHLGHVSGSSVEGRAGRSRGGDVAFWTPSFAHPRPERVAGAARAPEMGLGTCRDPRRTRERQARRRADGRPGAGLAITTSPAAPLSDP
jgi:hypothetical protein